MDTLQKIFSLTLVFNSLNDRLCYRYLGWFLFVLPRLAAFHPYLFDGNLFWIVVAAAALNVFKCTAGQKTTYWTVSVPPLLLWLSRLGVCIILHNSFHSYTVEHHFLVNNTSIAVNAGRFFLLGGLTLVIDDLPTCQKNRIWAELAKI